MSGKWYILQSPESEKIVGTFSEYTLKQFMKFEHPRDWMIKDGDIVDVQTGAVIFSIVFENTNT